MENKEQYIYKDGRYIKLSSFDHGAKIEIVDALPEIGNENTIYLLKEQEESGTNEDNNFYLQYIYKDGKYRLAGGGSTAAVKITYSELKALRDNSKLIPGQQYRIIDYVTTTAQENTQSAGHQFDIIVTADDEKTLNENARAALHEGDEYFQKITIDTKLVSANWKEGVTLSSISEEYKMSDDQEAYLTPIAENKAFTEMLTITNKDGIKVPCLLNPDPDGNGQDDYLVYCGTYEWKKTTNTLLTTYYTITEDKSQEYKGQCPSHADDIFVEIAYKDINGVSTPVLYKEDLGYYLSDNSSVDYGDEFRYLDDYVVDGVTYNRWLKYEDPTSSYYQILTNIIVVNNQFTVSPEEFKMAVQEITVIYDKWQECDSTGETRPGSVYYVLTNNLVNAETVIDTSVKTLANLSAWEIKYCLDNDTNRFTWAKDERIYTDDALWFIRKGTAIINGQTYYLWYNSNFDANNYLGSTKDKLVLHDRLDKISSDKQSIVEANYSTIELIEGCGTGVIYYMKDEWNNEAPYDFKNIQFKRYKITQCQEVPGLVGKYLGIKDSQDYAVDTADFIWCYTFTWINESNVVEDCSVIGQTLTNDERQYEGVFSNKLIECSAYKAGYWESPESFCIALNNIVIQATYSKDNGLFYGMYGNIFGSNCHDNTFGDSCKNNTFGNECVGNIFDIDCYDNTFGNNCGSNIFGWGCRTNTFGSICNGNIFRYNCIGNIFGDCCDGNTFGNYCDNNIFANYCSSNTFENYCSSNTFSNYCQDNTFGETYIQFNELKADVSYINLTSTSPAAATTANCLKNIIINPGVKGKDPNNNRTITVERNLAHSTTILAPGSKEIILDEE